ncbi:MAG: CopD family protein [Dehalococcoidia bacterium]
MVYQIAVLLHLLAVITWIGGSLFLVMVLVPLTRHGFDPPSLGAQVLGQGARKFRTIAWASMSVLIVTGLFIAWQHWGIGPKEFFSGTGWFFRVLQVKVGLFLVILLLSLFHDFVLGPRVSDQLERVREAGPPPPSLQKSRRLLVSIARINLLLILLLVALAVTLTRGAPW